jgi:hypothetical protein
MAPTVNRIGRKEWRTDGTFRPMDPLSHKVAASLRFSS